MRVWQHPNPKEAPAIYRSTLSAIGIAALAGTFAVQAQADSRHSDLAAETVKVWKVDRSGHTPSFRLRTETLPVSDITAFYEAETVERTLFRGRPPFSRHR